MWLFLEMHQIDYLEKSRNFVSHKHVLDSQRKRRDKLRYFYLHFLKINTYILSFALSKNWKLSLKQTWLFVFDSLPF